MRTVLSLFRSNNYYDGVRHSLKPLKENIKESLSKIPSLVIKMNLVITKTPTYSLGVGLATTPLQAVESFIDFISPYYKDKIVLAEEAAWGYTKEGFRMYGFAKLARGNKQIELLNLKEDEILSKNF